MKMQKKYLVKIKTGGNRDNIFFETDNISVAEKFAGVELLTPYQEVEVLGNKTKFYKNNTQITCIQ